MDDAFKALQTGSKLTLEIFPGIEQRVSPRLKLIGTRYNHVAEIAGTSERKANFDNRFRPLKRHSLERWINTYSQRERDGWPPIRVHKVNGKYFVEDGHHRVSVARATNMDSIEAEV